MVLQPTAYSLQPPVPTSHALLTIAEQSWLHSLGMDLNELDQRIDRLSIDKQLRVLLRNLTDVRRRLEISNLLWERVLAAEGVRNVDEEKLFDDAADTLIAIRRLVGGPAE